MVGIERQRLFGGPARHVRFIGPLQHRRQICLGLQVRLQPQGGLVVADRLVEAAQLAAGRAQVVVSGGVARSESNRPPVVARGRLESALTLSQQTQAVVRFRQLWVRGNRLFEVAGGLVDPARMLQQVAQVQVAAGVTGVDPECRPVVPGSPLGFA